MRLASLALVLGTSLTSAASIESLLRRANQTAAICSTLGKTFPGQVELPGSSNYTTETTSRFSLPPFILGPLAHAVCRLLVVPGLPAPVLCLCADHIECSCQGRQDIGGLEHAIHGRSGGHSPVAGVANINNGVLIVTTHSDVMKIVPAPNPLGAQYFSMEPAKRWGQAYDFLKPQGLNIVGGRLYSVGSGLILGGGISYLGYKHSRAYDNMLNFELVTGKGKVLQVNMETYPDLFWALKGGSNNFGIVTRYDMKTYPKGKVFGGTIVYQNTQDYLDAQQAWINPGGGIEDTNAAIMPNMNYTPLTNQSIATWVGLYNAPVDNPRSFENFTKFPAVSNQTSLTAFNAIVDQTKGYGGTVARRNWFGTAIKFYNDTMNFQYSTMVKTANELLAGLNVAVGMASEPVTAAYKFDSRHRQSAAICERQSNRSECCFLCQSYIALKW